MGKESSVAVTAPPPCEYSRIREYRLLRATLVSGESESDAGPLGNGIRMIDAVVTPARLGSKKSCPGDDPSRRCCSSQLEGLAVEDERQMSKMFQGVGYSREVRRVSSNAQGLA